MARLIHGAAAVALIALAAACLAGLAMAQPDPAQALTVKPACQSILCMFAIS